MEIQCSHFYGVILIDVLVKFRFESPFQNYYFNKMATFE